jgi:hypothetical protein
LNLLSSIEEVTAYHCIPSLLFPVLASKKQEYLSLLVGMQTTTMESSMGIPQKTKDITAI